MKYRFLSVVLPILLLAGCATSSDSSSQTSGVQPAVADPRPVVIVIPTAGDFECSVAGGFVRVEGRPQPVPVFLFAAIPKGQKSVSHRECRDYYIAISASSELRAVFDGVDFAPYDYDAAFLGAMRKIIKRETESLP